MARTRSTGKTRRKSTRARRKSMRLGSGGRFRKLKGKLARRKGVRNPGALAAYIGRKKYGSRKMGKWAKAGRKRAAR